MQKVEVQLEDDLTGGPADETVQFGVDGTIYELDLSARHAADFRHRLAPFVEHARVARPRGRGSMRTAASRERSRQIRAWAEQQGFTVSAHGRLPADVIRQYESAFGGGQPVGRAPQRTGASRKPSQNRGSAKTRRTAHRVTRRGTSR